MGTGLSTNFEQITYIFTTGYWKVHSAVSKVNHNRVCLWTIDFELLNRRIPDSSQQTAYLKGYLAGLQIARKLVHPKLLKILEIQESLSNPAFSSEPISSCLNTLIGSLDKIDSSYIGYQILDGLSFLHNRSELIHLGISPQAIFLNENLAVKIFNFNWATPSAGTETPTPFPFHMSNDPTMPQLDYTAPELVIRNQCYPQSDIFSFGMVLFEMLTSESLRHYRSMNEFDSTVDPTTYTLKVPEEFSIICSQCFQSVPTQRPTADSLISQEPFQTVPIKVLRYLDLIIAKEPKDKFGFFKGLSKVIADFSPMITKAKILPILVQECKSDPRFAPVLLGTIFSVSQKFSVKEFTEEVFKHISFLINVKDNPHILIALLQWIPLILEKTEKSLHADCVYPIVFQSIQSNNDQVQKEALKRLPSIINQINDNSIRTTLVPKLIDVVATTNDENIAASVMKSIADCMAVVDNDGFLLEQFPRVFKAWKRLTTSKSSESPVTEGMADVILSLKKASNKNIMSRAMQVAATVVAATNCQLYVQKKLCAWMSNTISQFKTVNSLDRPIDKPTDAELEALKSQKQPSTVSTPQRTSVNSPKSNSFDLTSPNVNSMNVNSPKPNSFGLQTVNTNSFNINSPNVNSFTPNKHSSQSSSVDFSFGTPQSSQSQLGSFDVQFPMSGNQQSYQNNMYSPQPQQQMPARQQRVASGGLSLPPFSPPNNNSASHQNNHDDLLNF